jgi:homoserine trans-succinylase
MKHVRKTAGYTWTDSKTNTEIAKEINITQILDKTQEYIRNFLKYVNVTPLNRLPRVLKTTDQQEEETKRDHKTDFYTCQTGKGQQVAQLHVI